MNDSTAPIIKPTKKFCRDRIFLRYNGRALTANEQKLLDFLLWCSLRYQTNIIHFSPSEYFHFSRLSNPSGRQYRDFYAMLSVLFETCIFWDLETCGAVSHILDDLIFNKNEINRKRNTLIQVVLHPSLISVLTWQRNNIILNLNVTNKLKNEYSYFLFIFLLADYIGDAKEHTYKNMQLRNYLNVEEKQSDKTFKALLRRAVKEITAKTFLNLTLKIRGNNFIISNQEKIKKETANDKNIDVVDFDNSFEKRLQRLEIMFNELNTNPIFREK